MLCYFCAIICRFKPKHLSSLKLLPPEHQKIARLLFEAEQQGVLDVYLAKLTHQEWLEVPQAPHWLPQA